MRDIWISSLVDYIEGRNDSGNNNKYGLQMSMTLSTHPYLHEYHEDIRNYLRSLAAIRRTSYKRPNVPKGSQIYPTIIVRGNESNDTINVMMCKNFERYDEDVDCKLKKALTDESFYERTLYIKDLKYKDIDPSLLQPFVFSKKVDLTNVMRSDIFWNTPMIFIGFSDLVRDGIFRKFSLILKSNPTGMEISSVEFMKYMSQPVIFWIRPAYYDFFSEPTEEFKEKYPDWDMLEYMIMKDNVSNGLFKELRDVYLHSMGRKLLASRYFWDEYYLEPQ